MASNHASDGKLVARPADLSVTHRDYGVEPAVREPSLIRVIWDAWKADAHRAGQYQGQAPLSLVYFIVLGPSAIAARLFGARLMDLDTRPRESYWVERKPAEKTMEAMERQF